MSETLVISAGSVSSALSQFGVDLEATVWKVSKFFGVTKNLASKLSFVELAKLMVSNLYSKGRDAVWGFLSDLGKQAGKTVSGLFSGIMGKIDMFKPNFSGFLKAKTGKIISGFKQKPLEMITNIAVGGLGVVALVLQLGKGDFVQGSLNLAETIYEFDFNFTDKALEAQIQSAFDSLYGKAGEFLGRSIAGVTVGTLFSPPKVTINIRTLAIQWRLAPELIEDMLQNVSNLAQSGLAIFRAMTVKRLMIQGRKGIKAMWKNASPNFKKTIENTFPGIGKNIEKWGDGSKPWSIEQAVEERIEKIPDKRFQEFVKEFISGFWQQFSEGVTYERW